MAMAMAMACSASLLAMAASPPAQPPSFPNAQTSSSDIRIHYAASSRRASSQSISTTLCPSLPFANLLWFGRCYNAQIVVSESEPADAMVKRFRREVLQSGAVAEYRRRRFFETPQEMKKRKQRSVAQRRKIRRTGFRAGERKKDEVMSVAVEDDDFWDYSEDGINEDL
eukprot:c23798_g1_i1 orf=620-1126(-)